MRILAVFGTRPEAIKMAPVIKSLQREQSWCDIRVCVTSQHREMLDQALALFKIEPHWDLDIMRASQSLTDITTGVLEGVQKVLTKWRANLILVHGDTTTTFAASLAAFYEKIDVGHVEAGLRTGNPYEPWPEEINRKLTGVLTKHHFAPTLSARENLVKEGVDPNKIVITGNTIIDSLFEVIYIINNNESVRSYLNEKYRFINSQKKLILVTGHRRENFGEGLKSICKAIVKLSKRQDVQIVYPVHFNPNVRKPVISELSNNPYVHIVEPLDYLSFVYLMNRCYIALTDSGGIQEEAPSLGKPVLVMRNTTERPEAVEAGTVRLVGTDEHRIVDEVERLLDDKVFYISMARSHNPYGDGKASQRITKEIYNNSPKK